MMGLKCSHQKVSFCGFISRGKLLYSLLFTSTSVGMVDNFEYNGLNAFAKSGSFYDVLNEFLNLAASIICNATFKNNVTGHEKSNYLMTLQLL